MLDSFTVVGAIAAILAAWLGGAQLVYYKRREDAQAIKEGLAAIARVTDLAMQRVIGNCSPEAAFRAGSEVHRLLALEIRHRSDGVQKEILEFYDQFEPIWDTAIGEANPMTVAQLLEREQELVVTMLRAFGNLTVGHCFVELMTPTGLNTLPPLKRAVKEKPARVEPTLGKLPDER